MLCPDHDWIARHIPHAGDMCLLDRVIQWSARTITGTASSHRNPAHPLRVDGHLGAVHGIEYAAQLMAVHSALLAGADEAPAAGYLAGVRDVHCHCAILDDVPGDLLVHAERLTALGGTVMYGFELSAAGHALIAGRATVVLRAPQ